MSSDRWETGAVENRHQEPVKPLTDAELRQLPAGTVDRLVANLAEAGPVRDVGIARLHNLASTKLVALLGAIDVRVPETPPAHLQLLAPALAEVAKAIVIRWSTGPEV